EKIYTHKIYGCRCTSHNSPRYTLHPSVAHDSNAWLQHCGDEGASVSSESPDEHWQADLHHSLRACLVDFQGGVSWKRIRTRYGGSMWARDQVCSQGSYARVKVRYTHVMPIPAYMDGLRTRGSRACIRGRSDGCRTRMCSGCGASSELYETHA